MSYSYFYSRPIFAGDGYTDESLPFIDGGRFANRSTDRAIDAALRNVPLPEGLITRLGMLVYTVTDEAADQVDYLGC